LLHSLLILVNRSKQVTIKDLARFEGIPARILAKLFTRLKQAGLVVGSEGIAGSKLWLGW
jgi:DNA-binding IscR family transcriptional regulator